MQPKMQQRKPVNGQYGHVLRSLLEIRLPPYARCYLDSALSGDKSAAKRLSFAAPNEWRGWIAVAAYHLGTPNPGYKELIRQIWDHDHQYLLAIAKRSVVRQMIISAQFDHPLSGSITVFRGVGGLSLRQAAMGLSWTASRNVACWFALRLGLHPLVVSAHIDATDIIYWEGSGEEEVVLRRKPAAVVDQSPETWDAAAKQYVKEAEARLEQARARWALKASQNRHG
jgi:hypothetical protein